MRLEDLKSPGQFKGALCLRKEVHKAICFAEVAAGQTNNKSDQARLLAEFFEAAAKHCYEVSGVKKPKKTKE